MPPLEGDLPIDEELTPAEDAAVREALDEIEVGQGVPLDEVIREIEARFERR